jgi:predicted DNA-binding transcriptional regulator YafY
MARSFIRCEDPALLAQVVGGPVADRLELRLLAATVAVSQAPIADVLAGLRDAGFAPAAEDSSGAIVDLRARGSRVHAAPHRRAHRPMPTPAAQTLEAVVAALRKVAAAPAVMPVDAATAVLLLQQAVRDQTSVVMGYVDAAGVATQRVVDPISVRGGQLMAFDPASGRIRDFAIHRVTSVVSVGDG